MYETSSSTSGMEYTTLFRHLSLGCYFCAFFLSAAAAAEERIPKVLLIGIDGVRPDALIVAETPHTNRLIARGAFDPKNRILGERYREANTVSGVGWSSILTGTWADKHGVHDNSFRGQNFDTYPHFFEYIKAARPEARTASFVSVWGPIDSFITSAADIREYIPLSVGRMDMMVTSQVDVRDGKWHHFMAVREDGILIFYLDGVKIASEVDTSGDFDLQGNRYYLGRDARGGSTVFDGDLRNFTFLNRALAESEVKNLSAGGDLMEAEGLILDLKEFPDPDYVEIDPAIREVTQGDFSVGAFFRTDDAGRNILFGNFGDEDHGHLNIELHHDNRLRAYINPPPVSSERRMEAEEIADSTASSMAIEALYEIGPDATFVYLHQPDAAGHRYHFCPNAPEYLLAIENVDRLIGHMVKTVRSRPEYEEENWLIVVTTDHGGYRTGHGRGHNIPEIYQGFLLLSGDSVYQRIIPEQSYIVDVVPTILKHLGINADAKLDGKAVGIRN